MKTKIETLFPIIYVGTYKKYNQGNLFGEWISLEEHSEDSFFEVCRELHKDEEDPELMFQDWENDFGGFIRESGIDSGMWNFLETVKDWDSERVEAYQEFINWYGKTATVEDFEDSYQGQYETEQDFAESLVSDCYDLNKMMGNLHYYFDYERFSNDLFSSDYHFSNGHVFRNI